MTAGCIRLFCISGPYGIHTPRNCEFNSALNCHCNGTVAQGASVSLGCSFQSRINACKFKKSTNPQKLKFRLEGASEVEQQELQETLENLSNLMAEKLKICAPQAHTNMVKNSEVAKQCRIGTLNQNPFSGVTCVMDFSAHSHVDFRNESGVATVGLTLKNANSKDKQYHVLTSYRPSQINSNVGGLALSMQSGSILIEVASVERHATTKLVQPNRVNPSRIGLIFYLHKHLEKPNHGANVQ